MEFGFEMYFNGRKRVNGQPADHVQKGNSFNAVDQTGAYAYTHLSSAAFERNVREEMAYREEIKNKEHQELIARAARKKEERHRKAFVFLKLKSTEDFDDVEEE